ncbi:SpaA isopeptide-forming pilin-related protein [Bifidobacterium catenulatum]|uniref:SpaA isopeptide-forming pilin-related protein n=1 Tax=Bifidobacterium catenulatum TaxID=1686 RepID=UPI003F93F5DB
MKMRKLFAGIAAAATLLGGMALGAASAQADGTVVDSPATFTFTADKAEQLTNRQLSFYKIGDYVQYGTGTSAGYGVQTYAANKTQVDAALETALGTNYNKIGIDNLAKALADGQLDQSATTRPWNNLENTRKFADALAQQTGLSAVNPTPAFTVNGNSATVSLHAGIYLVVDNTDATAGVTKAVPMIVSSGEVKDGVLTNPTKGTTVNFKNSVVKEPSKTVSATSVSVGETLTYTLTGHVANPKPEAFVFHDIPSVGLTVKADSFSATVDGDSVVFANYFTTDFNSLPDYKGDGTNEFTVTVIPAKLAELAGKTIVVTYEAVVNSEAMGNDVSNKLVKNDGSHDTVTTKLFSFSFSKCDNDNNALAGAVFKLSVADNQTGMLPTVNGQEYGTTQTSGDNGNVTFSGLKAGTYTVTETQAPQGYMNTFLPSFTVTIDENGNVTFGKDAFGLVNTTAKTVKNVKNVTQLPLTGAAGTTLFTVVALLVAGAGVTVAVKSRQRTH